MDPDLVQKAFESMKVVDIADIPTDTTKLKTEIEVVSELAKSDVILDVRAPDDVEKKPLTGFENEVILMPFYKTASDFNPATATAIYIIADNCEFFYPFHRFSFCVRKFEVAIVNSPFRHLTMRR